MIKQALAVLAAVLLGTIILEITFPIPMQTMEGLRPISSPTITPSPVRPNTEECPETMLFGNGIHQLNKRWSSHQWCDYGVFSVERRTAITRMAYSGVSVPTDRFVTRAVTVDAHLNLIKEIEQIDPERLIYTRAVYQAAINGTIHVILYEEIWGWFVPNYVLFADGTVAKLYIEHHWPVGTHEDVSLSHLWNTFEINEDGTIALGDDFVIKEGHFLFIDRRIWKYIKWDGEIATFIEYASSISPRNLPQINT